MNALVDVVISFAVFGPGISFLFTLMEAEVCRILHTHSREFTFLRASVNKGRDGNLAVRMISNGGIACSICLAPHTKRKSSII